MAVINFNSQRVAAGADLILWEGLSGDDTGKPLPFPKFPERTIHFYGDFGGGTATLEGSNDPRANPDHVDHDNAEWFELEDLNGIKISKTDSDGEGVAQSPHWIRPVLTGATGGSVTASLIARKN